MAFPFSKGRNNVFFQSSSQANQPVAPLKGNLQGRREQAVSKVEPSGTGPKKRYLAPNMGVNRRDEPPKSANWVGYSRPYQAKWNVRGKWFPPG